MVQVSELDREWFEGFDSYNQWLKSVKMRSGKEELSEDMLRNYESNLRKLVRFFRAGPDPKANPDSILAWAQSVKANDVVEMLNNFSLWLQGKEVTGYEQRVPKKGRKFVQKGTAEKQAHGVTRGFFTHNGILLPRVGRKSNGRSKVKKNDVNFAIFKIDPNNPTLVIKDYSQFKLFLGNLNFRDQTVALCMVSSSQDSGDLLNLNIGFVMSQEGRERLYWEGVREKTGEEFRTFISKEATRFLRQYVAQDREDADVNDPIFMARAGDPLSVKTLSDNFRWAANKMGITNGAAQNPFRPKRMRSIFSSACYQAKIDDGARHIFMGHAGTISEKYREMPAANLELIYQEVEPYVTVFTEDRTQELTETRKKTDKAINLALDVLEENKQLKAKVENLTATVMNLAESLGEMDGLKSRIEELEDYVDIGTLRKMSEKIEASQVPNRDQRIPPDMRPLTEKEVSEFPDRKKRVKELKEKG